MPKRIVVTPYKNGCAGLRLVKEHSQALGINVVEKKVVGSKLKFKQGDVCINWGVSTGGKLRQLTALQQAEVPCLEFVDNIEDAKDWIRDGFKVVCRTILNGHGGAGIVVAETEDQLVLAPLYTKYQKKKREFRVHCFDMGFGKDVMYMVSEKKMMARERRPEQFNALIRNHDNGWVFARNNLDPVPDDIYSVAHRAIISLGIQFGAVDIGWHRDTGCFVFEVNTAPGADNETAEFYANIFKELAEE